MGIRIYSLFLSNIKPVSISTGMSFQYVHIDIVQLHICIIIDTNSGAAAFYSMAVEIQLEVLLTKLCALIRRCVLFS